MSNHDAAAQQGYQGLGVRVRFATGAMGTITKYINQAPMPPQIPGETCEVFVRMDKDSGEPKVAVKIDVPLSYLLETFDRVRKMPNSAISISGMEHEYAQRFADYATTLEKERLAREVNSTNAIFSLPTCELAAAA